MSRPRLEVADIFRAHGPAYRREQAGHLNLPQLRVMSAIESCRTAALGGHVADGTRWIGCRPGFFLPVKVLSRLFRRLFLEGLARLHKAGKLAFFGNLSELANPDIFAARLAPRRKTDWVVYAKPPFGGPEAVLAYLSRYTHRVAISNHRLVSADADTVAFRWKDYRIKRGDRMKVMRLPVAEFIRRFLVHVLPSGFHRIRHAGFLANGIRRDRIEKIRRLIDMKPEPDHTTGEDGHADAAERDPSQTCPKCGGAMIVIETFTRGQTPRSRAPPWEDAA
ncbi:IS91 family transposase [Roseovarius sp. S1116L3]|uniref:IS91 family transposase n=1 Tax=Roseovarius roseus TaxID=3342636 RepID=UPI00372A9E70